MALATQKLDLGEIARAFAERDSSFCSTRVEVHTIDPRDLERSSIYLQDSLTAAYGKHPVSLTICKLNGFRTLVSMSIPHVGSEGNIVLFNKVDELILPEMDALLILSPIVHDGGSTNETLAMSAISQVRAQIVCAMGRAFVLARAAVFSVNADDGKFNFVSPVFRMPQPLDFRASTDPTLVSDISQALATASEGDRVAVEQALDFCGRAAVEQDETFRFTLYWLALEIAAGGRADAIAARLGQAYGTHKAAAYAALGFRAIADARHGFIHRGMGPDLTHVVERTMQACLIDIARWRLKLPCKRFAEAIRAGM